MEDAEEAQEAGPPGSIRMASKNYHRQITCAECGNSVRDDRLKDHQQSSRCKKQDVVLTMSPEIHKQIMALAPQLGFYQIGNRLIQKNRAVIGQIRAGTGQKPGRNRP